MKSSTDYGNTTLGEETISFLNNEQQKPPSWDYRSSLFIHRIVIMVLLITTTLSTSLVFYELYKIPQFPPKTLWSKDVPNVFLHPILDNFTVDNRYAEFTDAGDGAWQELVPKGRGFVMLKDNTGETDDLVEYRVASYHQLHCMYMIRKSLRKAFLGEPVEPEIYPPPAHTVQEHIEHCVDYIRITIMCLADATLERQNLVGEDGGLFWGADHVCQNRDELFDWSYNSRSNERTGLVHGEG